MDGPGSRHCRRHGRLPCGLRHGCAPGRARGTRDRQAAGAVVAVVTNTAGGLVHSLWYLARVLSPHDLPHSPGVLSHRQYSSSQQRSAFIAIFKQSASQVYSIWTTKGLYSQDFELLGVGVRVHPLQVRRRLHTVKGAALAILGQVVGIVAHHPILKNIQSAGLCDRLQIQTAIPNLQIRSLIKPGLAVPNDNRHSAGFQP